MRADAVLAAALARRSGRRTLPWAAAFGLVVYTSAATYVAAYPSVRERVGLARALQGNAGLAALFGTPHRIDTVWGFDAWRSVGVLTIVGGVWGVITGAALLRGEEDAGRWEVLLSGALRPRTAAAAGVAAALTDILVLWFGCLAAVGLAATSVPAPGIGTALAIATTVVAPAAVFLAVGLVCGQLASSRREAAVIAGAVFAAAYLLRVVGTASGPSWVSELTPLGWVDDARPATGVVLFRVVQLGVVVALLFAVTVVLAGRRDVGAGFVRELHRRRAPRLLTGAAPLAVHRARLSAAGWLVGIVVVCGVLGVVARSVGRVADTSSGFRSIADRLGATGVGTRGFLGLTMSVLVTAVALAAASGITAVRQSEASGWTEVVLTQAITRRRWLALQAGAVLGVVALLGVLIGTTLWVAGGAGADPGVRTMLAAGVNAASMGLAVWGLGVLALGVSPRWTATVAYGVVAWSFLLEFVGALLRAPHWLLDLSLLHHVALAPAAAPDWGTNLVLALLGVGAAVIGVLAFQHRDVAGA